MGLFDFPRINFRGNIDINVPTINNAYYFPLTIYDSQRSVPLFPPRLYFQNAEQINSVAATAPYKAPPIYDPLNEYYYIEISTVQDIPTLREWLQKPLEDNLSDPLNGNFIPYYKSAEQVWQDTEGTTLISKVMGYWNMWGDMGVSMSDVQVCGVQKFENNQVSTYNKDSSFIPPDVAPFLNASFDFDTAPASGRTTASMVETLSSQSVYANIFCTTANLYNSENPDQILLQGSPFRFSALIYSAWRALNWLPPMAGSARFVSSIPLEEINQDESAALLNFFDNNKAYDPRPVKGVFVTFQTFEVFENRYDQNIYTPGELVHNPAQAYTVGSICPWYEGDMKAGVLGRQLNNLGSKAIRFGRPGPIIYLTPVITNLKVINPNLAIYSMDFGNTWPEKMQSNLPSGQHPAKRGDASFTTYPLGKLDFRYGNTPQQSFYSINVNPRDNPRDTVFQKGCIFDTVITDSALISNIENNFIQVFLSYPDNTADQILAESEYMIATDQKGCYGEEGDLASEGYMVYSSQKESCKLRIFQKGRPVTSPVPIYNARWKVFEAANDPIKPAELLGPFMYSDGDTVNLAEHTQLSSANDNSINYFIYDNQYPIKIETGKMDVPLFNTDLRGYTIMDTGSFVCLRVHENKDAVYEKYYDQSNWGTTPPDFDVIYEEVFKLYDIVYPIMAHIHPFSKEVWDNSVMAGLVLQRTDPAKWENILYMPKSRELSRSQRKLLEAWATYLQNRTT